ncbi:hypothetical protein PR202_ga05424 [Eleusine coracana subsp. coracana]|uniref:Uncharacterized protein n=1 Tax=Eleusine coracana subsp. coracana TaxID=191504 RepID=A0AAV5BSJ8_ELECO|nr:hypothetical protein PR202_ga04971 [Eleusine coracana subsp. coracana]GJM89253.1 hypothetical protein PR202_ga05424 [Eleusine coracana subsp. coracana]
MHPDYELQSTSRSMAGRLQADGLQNRGATAGRWAQEQRGDSKPGPTGRATAGRRGSRQGYNKPGPTGRSTAELGRRRGRAAAGDQAAIGDRSGLGRRSLRRD